MGIDIEIIFKLYSVQIIKKNCTAFQKCWKWKLGEAGGILKSAHQTIFNFIFNFNLQAG